MLAFALCLPRPGRQPPTARWPRLRLAARRCLALAGGDLLLLQLRRARLADRDRRPLEPDPAGGAAGAAAAGAAALPAAAGDAARDRSSSPGSACWPLVGPFGFGDGFNKVAGSNTYGPVSPVETLGVWPASNYRLDAAGGAHLTGLAGGDRRCWRCSLGVAWWVRRRELAVPIALGACAVLYLVSLPFSGDYSQAKALMIAAPLAMLVAIRPLLAELGRRELAPRCGRRPRRLRVGWAVLAVVFVGGAALLELPGAARRAGRAARARRRAAGLPADRPRRAGALRRPGPLRRLRAARRRHPRAAGRVPRRRRRRRTRRSRSTPATPTARSTSTPSRAATLERFPYVITGRAAWNSEAPAELQADRRDPLLRALGSGPARPPRRPPRPARGDRGRRRSPTAPRRRSASCSPTPAAPRSSPTP